MFNWLKKLFNWSNCSHDFKVHLSYYTDKSYGMKMPSIHYSAICNKCGETIEPRYIYGANFNVEELKNSLDNNNKPGKEYFP